MSVTDKEYTADMSELSARAAGIIRDLKEEVRIARRLAWLLVNGLSGKIIVTRNSLLNFNADRAVLHQREDVRTGNFIFESDTTD